MDAMELTWEQQQDIQDFESWKAEYDWQVHLERVHPDYPMFDFDAELDDLIEGRLDDDYHASGAW